MEEKKQRHHEFRLKRLETRTADVDDLHDTNTFRLSSAVKFVSKFTEVDVENHFVSFEKVLTIHGFPKDKFSA